MHLGPAAGRRDRPERRRPRRLKGRDQYDAGRRGWRCSGRRPRRGGRGRSPFVVVAAGTQTQRTEAQQQRRPPGDSTRTREVATSLHDPPFASGCKGRSPINSIVGMQRGATLLHRREAGDSTGDRASEAARLAAAVGDGDQERAQGGDPGGEPDHREGQNDRESDVSKGHEIGAATSKLPTPGRKGKKKQQRSVTETHPAALGFVGKGEGSG